MVRIGDADIGRGIGGNIGDDVIVYPAVVRIQAQVYRYVRIQVLEIRNGLIVNVGLSLVGIVF